MKREKETERPPGLSPTVKRVLGRHIGEVYPREAREAYREVYPREAREVSQDPNREVREAREASQDPKKRGIMRRRQASQPPYYSRFTVG